MDIRLMEYYLAVTREGNISAAAESLHVSQPGLSRQMKELEDELGVTLFERGSRKITLTEEGMILRKRAEEMVHLMQLTEKEITNVKNKISGDIRIGAGESHAFHFLSRAAGELMQSYPDIRLHITSGDTNDLMEQLDNGLLDFALIFSDFDRSSYQTITLPLDDTFGVLMRKEHKLAVNEYLTVNDLYGEKLIVSRASEGLLFANADMTKLNIVATYNLVHNASILVEDKVGLALCFDHLVNTGSDSPLSFLPLRPSVSIKGTLIWKKYQVLSPAVRLFIDSLNRQIEK